MLAGEAEAIIAMVLCITFFGTKIFEVKFPWEEIRLHGYLLRQQQAPPGPGARAHHQIYKTKKKVFVRIYYFINIF